MRALSLGNMAYTYVAIADLVALLFTLISLWFAVQKFFWVRLDATLSTLAALGTSIALWNLWHIQRIQKNGRGQQQLTYLSVSISKPN